MKQTIKWILLVFIAVTIGVQIGKSFKETETRAEISDGVTLIFFHAKVRCKTCTTMESHVRKTLDTYFPEETAAGDLAMIMLDYEAPENRELVERFAVGTTTVVLLNQRQGKEIASANLASDCWKLVGNESAFVRMLKPNIETILAGESPVHEAKNAGE